MATNLKTASSRAALREKAHIAQKTAQKTSREVIGPGGEGGRTTVSAAAAALGAGLGFMAT